MESCIIGKTLKNRYEIIQELSGAKEAGKIYLARDIQDNSKKIIKVSNYDENCDREVITQSFTEKDRILINLDSKLTSPVITDFFIISKKRFVVMEYKIQKTLPELLIYPFLGRTLRKRYNVVKGLYNTKWGSLYLIKDIALDDSYWFLKEIKNDIFSLILEKEDFKKVALKLKALAHPGLPRFSDFFAIKDNYYLVTEYTPGYSLEEMRHKESLSEEDILDISVNICDAIEYVHHYSELALIGNISSGNIIHYGREKIKIVNFEIPHLFKVFNLPGLYLTLLDKYYTVPEKINIEPPSDLYSLGVIMHYLITGVEPKKFHHSFPHPIEYNENISLELNNIVMKALQKDRAQRYEDPVEMKRALMAILQTKDRVKQKNLILSEIEKHEKNEDYNKAIEAYEELLKSDPRNEDILCKIGFCYENLKDYGKTIEYYTKADEYCLSPIQKRNIKSKIKSNKILLHLKNGVFFEKNEQNDKAIENYLELLKFDPNNQDGLLRLAKIYENTDLKNESMKMYYRYKEVADEKNRKNIIKKINQMEAEKIIKNADILRENGQYEEAIANYKKALKVDQKNEKANYGLALTCEIAGKTKEALKIYISLMNTNPLSPLKKEIDDKINKLSQFVK